MKLFKKVSKIFAKMLDNIIIFYYLNNIRTKIGDNKMNNKNDKQMDFVELEELANDFATTLKLEEPIINKVEQPVKSTIQKEESKKMMPIDPTTFLRNAIENSKSLISSELELLAMIPNWSNPNANALSKIFHTFKGIGAKRNTDIPVGLPIFSYIVFLASQMVQHNIKYVRPTPKSSERTPEQLLKSSEHLNMWLLLLADSGDSKTFSIDVIKEAMQVEEDFNEVNSALAFAQSISENPKGLWLNDEFGQLWAIMQGSESTGQDWKKVFLQAKDGKVEWKSKATHIPRQKGLAVSALLMNTESQLNASTSDQSLKDGMVRRLNVAYVVEDDLKNNFQHLVYDKTFLIDEITPQVQDSLQQLENYRDQILTFHPDCLVSANNVYELAGAFYSQYFGKPFIRTYLNEAFKFAAYMHIITKQQGTVISPETMERGLAVSLILLDSFKKFLSRRLNNVRKSDNANNRHPLKANPKNIHTKDKPAVAVFKAQLDKLFIKEKVKGFKLTRRDIQRTYPNLSTSDIDSLTAIYTEKSELPEQPRKSKNRKEIVDK